MNTNVTHNVGIHRDRALFATKALPFRIVAVVFRLMVAKARMFPSNAVLVPIVAELPTCQNTPSSAPPLEPKLITETDEPLAVVNALPIWKTQNALLLPWASSCSVPVS